MGIERAAFEKLALRRAADIGEFFDRADPAGKGGNPQGWTGPAVGA